MVGKASTMLEHLATLAKISFHWGLIGVDEFQERIVIAKWLAESDGTSTPDPRVPEVETERSNDFLRSESEILAVTIKDEADDAQDWLEFLFDGQWIFTKSDPDPYPSMPHGHLRNANRPWPKLNPYTGRAFSKKYQEATQYRLSKSKMQQLWRNQKFRTFCRDHIVWYMEEHPYHGFPVKDPLRFPTW